MSNQPPSSNLSKVKKFFIRLGFLFAAIAIAVAVSEVIAWTNPSSAPPSGAGVLTSAANAPAGSIYIKADGNVGIGTTNPGVKLEIAGNIIASDPTALSHLITKAYAENNYKDPPGQWTCTLRASPSGGTSATASCVGLEKVINGGCEFSANWDDQPYHSRPINQGWYCYNSGGNAAGAWANCCL